MVVRTPLLAQSQLGSSLAATQNEENRQNVRALGLHGEKQHGNDYLSEVPHMRTTCSHQDLVRLLAHYRTS